MNDDKDPDIAIISKISTYLEREELAVNSAMHTLYGEVPNWIPSPSIERAKRTIQKLINDGLSSEGISQRVSEAERDKLTFPGTVTDPSAFAQSIYELAHLRYSISLGESKGLLILAGEQAARGQKFKPGRKPGAGGPPRKAIAKLLATSPTMKNPELWDAIKAKPPRGWHVYESPRLGKYLEGPNNKSMRYARFCNVCGEERKKLKRKITG